LIVAGVEERGTRGPSPPKIERNTVSKVRKSVVGKAPLAWKEFFGVYSEKGGWKGG